MRRILRMLTLTALWWALWIACEQKLAADELTAGLGCAVLAGLASELAWGRHLTSFGANPRLLVQAWRLPLLFVTGTWEIVVVLCRHLFTRHKAESLLQEVAFDAGDADDPDAAERRALAIVYTTMTPNFVIIGIDRERQTMLYHQLVRSEVPTLTRNLGARP